MSLFNILDLIFNIALLIGIIYLANYYLTSNLNNIEGFNKFFEKQDIPVYKNPESNNIHNMNNDYNDLLQFIYGKSELFNKTEPITEFTNTVNLEPTNNDIIRELEIQNRINKKPNSTLPYNDNIVSLQNDNLLNNHNENVAQISNFNNKK